jgi:hypothetical protein
MTLRSIGDLLAAHPFFAGLPGADVDLIAGCGENVRVGPGEMLFTEGTAADRFYVIRRGRISLTVHGPGQGDIAIATVTDGDVLGWSWLFPPYRWHYDARSVAEVSAVALDGGCLRGKCDDDPALGYRLMQRFARLMEQRLQETRLQLDVRFRRRAGSGWSGMAAGLSPRTRLSHGFHVFAVYPWVGLLRSGPVEHPLYVLDRCRIRWGTVVAVEDLDVIVTTRLLQWDGTRLRLGGPVTERVRRGRNGVHLLEVAPGDAVALHWDWVCERLDAAALASLQRDTRHQLAAVNVAVSRSGRAALLS